jgi:hypothetical protein
MFDTLQENRVSGGTMEQRPFHGIDRGLCCKEPTRRRLRVAALASALAAITLWVSAPLAYPTYSNCAICHGDFNSGDYQSLVDETPWLTDLMSAHQSWVNDCRACHETPGSVPVSTSSSNSLAFSYSCVGCHGRLEDRGSPPDTSGMGSGLRAYHLQSQKYFDALPTFEPSCATCHPNDPTPVGENMPPPNFSALGWNPCSDPQFGPTGLDNDGDGLYDGDDAQCAPGAPGETAGSGLPALLVAAHDPVAGTISLSFGTPCGVYNNNIESGALDQVSTYSYDTQECNIGNTGAYTWSYPLSSTFFVIVGNNGVVEGSYGTDSDLAERPEDATSSACPIQRSLLGRCD